MLRDDLDEELEAERPQKDVELTLGPAVLFAIVCGLVLLCGLCFGVGYTSGRRSGARTASAKEAASGQTLAAQAAHKPAAKGTPPTVQAASQQSDSSASGAGTSQSATNLSTNPVRPAIGSQTAPSQAGSVPQVQPALPPGSGVMVQIAAVSHVEDANVLMGALRKRGYEVTARRETDDNLIHVQIGPFATRNEASAMSQRLLNDGYNAVVLP